MTLTGDFGGPPIQEPAPNYPTLFGVTLTPMVSGILIALLGLGGAVYLATLLIAPKVEEAAQLQTEITQQENDLSQREVILRQLNDVIAARERTQSENADVRSLFATQEALDTLLLDINRLILASDAQLNSFQPDSANSGIVQDGSLGPDLNAKLKRQVTNVTIQGDFASVVDVMQKIDQQQNFLMINNLTMEQVTDEKKPGEIIATFQLTAYIPLTPEEIAALAPPPQEGGEQQPQDQQQQQQQ